MSIAIIGTGRFGHFWANLLQERLPSSEEFLLYDSENTASIAGMKKVSYEVAARAEVIFFCVPISHLKDALRTFAPHIQAGAVIADTCSVKTYAARCMQEILPQHCTLLATHPMFGPDSFPSATSSTPPFTIAKEQRKPTLVMSFLRGEQQHYQYWQTQFQNMGLYVKEMTPDEHDKVVAETQGLTHLIGRVLRECNIQKRSVATKGFSSLYEVMQQTCNDDIQLFYDLIRFNPHSKAVLQKLKLSFSQIYEDLHS